MYAETRPHTSSGKKSARKYFEPTEREVRLTAKDNDLRDLFDRAGIKFELPDYSSQDYWNLRYQKEKGLAFDWLQSFESLKIFFERKLSKMYDVEILHIGCGNSTLPEDLYTLGYKNISNIDFSYVVIKQMLERYSEFEEMDFEVMDATDIKYDNECFDYIIDKATLDCVLASDDSVDKALDALHGIYRILKSRGDYIMISSSPPEFRLGLLKSPNLKWRVTTFELDNDEQSDINNSIEFRKHYMYICTKP